MSTEDTTDTNEIIAAAKDAKEARERATAPEPRATAKKLPVGTIGVGLGIGSAALAAALLYARRRKKD